MKDKSNFPQEINQLALEYIENLPKENVEDYLDKLFNKIIIKGYEFLSDNNVKEEVCDFVKNDTATFINVVRRNLKAYKKCADKDNFYGYLYESLKHESYHHLENEKLMGLKISQSEIKNTKINYISIDDEINENIFEYNSPEFDNKIIETEEFMGFFNLINQYWNKCKDKIKDFMSELLTCSILNNIEKQKINLINIETFASELSRFEFVNKEILNNFFNDKTYKLPTNRSICEKYCFEKSAGSKYLNRFYKKIKESVNF